MIKNLKNCLICSGKGFQIKTLKETAIYKCDLCQLEFTDLPTGEELNKFYLNYNDVRAREDVVTKNAEEIINYLKKYGLSKESRLLDFGCGDNFFIKQGDSKNWFSYDKYTKPEMPNDQFNFITIFGVLEHLINPIDTINKLSAKLKEGGKIIITTAGIDTGLPYVYKYPEHITYWNKNSIKKLFQKTNFKIIEISNRSIFQNPKTCLQIILKTREKTDNIQTNFYRTFNAFTKIFLKSLYGAIAKKKFIKIPTNEIFIIGEKRSGNDAQRF